MRELPPPPVVALPSAADAERARVIRRHFGVAYGLTALLGLQVVALR